MAFGWVCLGGRLAKKRGEEPPSVLHRTALFFFFCPFFCRLRMWACVSLSLSHIMWPPSAARGKDNFAKKGRKENNRTRRKLPLSKDIVFSLRIVVAKNPRLLFVLIIIVYIKLRVGYLYFSMTHWQGNLCKKKPWVVFVSHGWLRGRNVWVYGTLSLYSYSVLQ